MGTPQVFRTILTPKQVREKLSRLPRVRRVTVTQNSETAHYLFVIQVSEFRWFPSVQMDAWYSKNGKTLSIRSPQALCAADGTEEAKLAFLTLNTFVAALKDNLEQLLNG